MAQQWNPRQAMLEEDFELFHYLDRTVEVELHHHDFYEVYLFLSGHVRYCIEGQTYRLVPGDILLVAPDELHQPLVHPGQEYERYVLWVDPRYLARLSAPDADLSACFEPGHACRRRVLRAGRAQSAQVRLMMEQLTALPQPEGYARLEQQALVSLLLTRLNRLCADAPVIEPDDQLTSTMTQVLQYIDSHLTEPLTLELLARQFYLSKYHLLREFQKRFGTTIHKYVQKRRLMLAKGFLYQGQRPSVIYTQCGFKDYATFYRAFVGEYGLSPRAYQSFARREA